MREADCRRTAPRGHRPAASVLAGVLVLAALAAPLPASADSPSASAAAFLAGGGDPGDFELVYEIPAVGGAPWVGKLVDRRTGAIQIVYRWSDGVLGGPELFEARTRSAGASDAFAAKADAALQTAVREWAPSETIPVGAWLQADVSDAERIVEARHPELTWLAGRPVSGNIDAIRTVRGELWEARRAVYAAAAAALDSQVADLGGTIAYASSSAPLVFLDLPVSATPALAARGDVVSMGLEGSWSPQLSSAGPSVDADWTGGPGDQGTGIRVGIVEYHNVRGAGDLSGRVVARHSTTGTLAYTSGGQFDHPTWVAGAVASQSSTYRGVAPGALIVTSGTGGYTPSLAYDRRIIAAADWAISPSGGDADIVNTSLAQDTTQGAEEARRYFDSIVDRDGRLAVSATGNYVNFNNWKVGSPGTGWNVVAVGGVDDRGTASRTDDVVWYAPGANGANWLDPPGTAWNAHGDFNKPNLVAPAVGVRTANGLAASGTSAATPIVAGVAAQVMANQPTLLSWPEGTRAILMAGATHHVPMPDGSSNADHEGVGMTSAAWSNRIAVPGDGQYGGYRIGALSSGQSVTQQIAVQAGDRLRVAVAWNAHTQGSSNLNLSDGLHADLDLRLRLPNGAVSGSYTLDNAYEFVEVTAPTSGVATIEIVEARFDGTSERYGLAWAKVRDATPPTASAVAPAPGEPWAVPSVPVSVAFGEAVDGVSGSTFWLERTATGRKVRASVALQPSGLRATLTPARALSPGRYRVHLTTGIRDMAGNQLLADSWTFMVKRPAGIAATSWGTERRIRLSAGTHVGFRFDAGGAVTGRRRATLATTVVAHVAERRTLPGMPGIWLHVTDGGWGGYWLRESAKAGLVGKVDRQKFGTPRRVVVAAGTQTGYRFDAEGRVTASKRATIGARSGASVSARMVVNGRWYLRVVDGVWAGYWLRESTKTYLPGVRELTDLGTGSGIKVKIGAGARTAYRYASSGTTSGQLTGSTAATTRASSAAWGIVNGRPRFLIMSGTWAGYWLREGSGVRLP